MGEEGLGMEESAVMVHSDNLYCDYDAWQNYFPSKETCLFV